MDGQEGQIDFDVSGGVLGEAEEGVFRTAVVRVPYSADLVDVLEALDGTREVVEGWSYEVADGGVMVRMGADLDARLEALIADLGRLRWGYEPGRVVQLALVGEFLPWT